MPKHEASTIHIPAADTLTALELNHGDAVAFTLRSGEVRLVRLENTGAEIVRTTLKKPGVEESGAVTVYRFWTDVLVNGEAVRLEREVGTQASFYEPPVVQGVRLWLDAVDDIFSFMNETHGPCRPLPNCSHYLPPFRQARLALQDATLRICPDKLRPWCPLPEEGLKIEQCYQGEDCWLGAYFGASAHAGLDINHPAGTPLSAPLDLDSHFLFNRTTDGANNNRWRGFRRWPNGDVWVLRSAHMVKLTVPENTPLKAGTQYAEGAGVWVGKVQHSHFAFEIFTRGELVRLDPWILFWQMYQDQ